MLAKPQGKTLNEVMSNPVKKTALNKVFDGSLDNPYYFYIGSYTLQELTESNVFNPSDLDFSEADLMLISQMFE